MPPWSKHFRRNFKGLESFGIFLARLVFWIVWIESYEIFPKNFLYYISLHFRLTSTHFFLIKGVIWFSSDVKKWTKFLLHSNGNDIACLRFFSVPTVFGILKIKKALFSSYGAGPRSVRASSVQRAWLATGGRTSCSVRTSFGGLISCRVSWFVHRTYLVSSKRIAS